MPSKLWYENQERELLFPDHWQVDDLHPPGFAKKPLSASLIREKIIHPLAGPSLTELVKNKKQAVIIFDDMTRPTPVKEISLPILEILHESGMKREQIRFLWALGAHGAQDMISARKKLGEEIVENYPIYNHDPFQNTLRIGRTPTGVELWFNREFLNCDLKIGIGSITPHVHVGFGGGAKIVLPGVAGIETINQFHNQLYRDPLRTGLGNFENNIMRAECDAAGEAAGLNFKVDCLINRYGQITDIYAGHFRSTHQIGAEEAKEHYGIKNSGGFDIVVANAYGKANEAAIALLLALRLLKSKEGVAVLIADAPEGQVPHYVMRAWGTEYGGRHYAPRSKGFLQNFLRKLIVLAPYPDRTFLDLICHIDDALLVKSWAEALAILEKDFPEKAKVGVIQDGTMMFLKK
ncbi:MAG: lactate racemase domain-containing protein [Thermodesulfobacteriota bacterium]